MATVFHVKGYITEDGQLQVELPEGWQPGEVEVTITVTEKSGEEIPWEERPWTDEEIAYFLRPEPKSGAEIVALGHTGGWEQLGITDGVEWVEEQRRQRRERRR